MSKIYSSNGSRNNVTKMQSKLESMNKDIIEIKYKEYLKQVKDLNTVKDYLKIHFTEMSEETKKIMADHIT